MVSQRTGRIVDHFAVGALPQHVTPSWDLRTLWVTNDQGNSLTPIDPRTGRHGRPVPVTDPYNLYFTADGRRAIVVAEAHRELDFRDAAHDAPAPRARAAAVRRASTTWTSRLRAPRARLVRVRRAAGRRRPARASASVRTIALRAGAMPQDVKLSPDGRTFYVADMMSGGVWLIDARALAR